MTLLPMCEPTKSERPMLPQGLLCLVLFLGMPLLSGCEDTDLRLATEAGIDAVKAVALTDTAIQELAARSTTQADSQYRIAPPESPQSKRMQALAQGLLQEGELRFDVKVYLADEVNAFAMANGTIRFYSGLMDLLNDGELRFVLGHEMGHVVKKHISKKMRLAYAASAVRKGIASQNNMAGEIARSQLGGFTELLMRAQFSQAEEREADDYGLSFLQRRGFDQKAAVSALSKLATLGKGHSFLSSHPDPDKRAERLAQQLGGG